MPPYFVELLSLCVTSTLMLMQFGPYLGLFYLLSDCVSPRLVRYAEVEFVIKPRYPTSIRNIFIMPFLTHCSCRSSYLSNWPRCAQSKFSSVRTFNSTTKLFNLTKWTNNDNMRTLDVNAISVGNASLCSNSVTTCQSVQPSNNDD